MASDEQLLRRAIALAHEARRKGYEPFGAVLALDHEIVYEAYDRSLPVSDPAFHAELSVISEYCRREQLIRLDGHMLFSSAEPCVMCAGAIFWSRLSRLVFSVSQQALRRLSDGPPRLSCASLVNPDRQRTEVVGPWLEEEGLAVFEGFIFGRKVQRHAAMHAFPEGGKS
jgi:tRNA(Arg) A34 adenosine deaminase TadA